MSDREKDEGSERDEERDAEGGEAKDAREEAPVEGRAEKESADDDAPDDGDDDDDVDDDVDDDDDDDDDGDDEADDEASDAVGSLGVLLEDLGKALDRDALEPSADRDYAKVAADIDALADRVDEAHPYRGKTSIYAVLDAAVKEAESRADLGDFTPDVMRAAVSNLVAEVGALSFRAGKKDRAARLFERARELATEETRAALDAASRDPASYADLAHANFLQRKGRYAEADAVAKAMKGRTAEPALRESALRALRSPRPMAGAPVLSTINGVGTMLYGERDLRSDGSYIATLCFVLLFVPIVPLRAYRVAPQDGGYVFLAREALSPFARLARVGVPLGILLVGGVIALGAWLGSDSRSLASDLEDAAELAQAGHHEEARDAYFALFERYGDSSVQDELDAAATGTLRSAIAAVAEPITADRVDEARGAAAWFGQIPPRWRDGERAELLVGAAIRWADQIGFDDEAEAQASLRLLELAAPARETASYAPVKEARDRRHAVIGDALVADWPLLALEHYLEMDAPPQERVRTALGEVVAEPSLLVAERARLAPMVGKLGQGGAELQRAVDAAVARAEGERPYMRPEVTADEVRAWLVTTPRDQTARVRLADLLEGQANEREAIETLRAIGKPGVMTAEARDRLVDLLMRTDELEEADAILTRVVGARLPAFLRASEAYDARGAIVADAAWRSLDTTTLPPELEARLSPSQSAEEQQGIAMAWVQERVMADVELTRLREALAVHSTTVGDSLRLGMVKLRRAAGESGDARERLLAQAERAFLDVQVVAAGSPDFHLGLGETYHRLGKTEEGEAQLRAILDEGDPFQMLAVASVYRGLQLFDRAEETAERVAEGGHGEASHEAALLLGVMADDPAEAERWFLAVPAGRGERDLHLKSTRAALLVEAGEDERAGELLLEAAVEWESKGEAPAPLNNAAMARLGHYQMTGNLASVERAVELQERSLALDPDNSVLMTNLMAALQHSALLHVLQRWIRLDGIAVDVGDATRLVEQLAAGPLREDIVAGLRAEAHIRRVTSLAEQLEVLAPASPYPYGTRLWVLSQYRDDAALAALLARIEALELEIDAPERQIEEARERRTDPQRAERNERSIARARRVLSSVTGRSRPTEAIAKLLLSERLLTRAEEALRPEDAREALELERSAAELWPALGTGGIETALFAVAMAELRRADGSLEERWQEERFTYDEMIVLSSAASDDSALAASVASRAELRDALALARAGEPSPRRLLLATLARDTEAEAWARAGLRATPRLCTEMRIATALSARHPGSLAWLELACD